jgi:hypothetical protein
VESRKDPRPIVVWLHRASEPDLSDACDSHLDADWQASLALDRFDRYRLNVDAYGRDELRERYRTPAYVFFDPAGEEIARVEGEKAADCKSFERALEKAWRKTFDQNRKRYVKAMEDILDDKEEIARRREALVQDRQKLADERNPGRKRLALDREEDAVDDLADKVFDRERETRSALTLREEYRPS